MYEAKTTGRDHLGPDLADTATDDRHRVSGGLRAAPGATVFLDRAGTINEEVYYTEQDVEALHRYMDQLLAEEGAHIDGYYYCPHHPEHGIGAYKVRCHCRKPDTGMFEAARQRRSIRKK